MAEPFPEPNSYSVARLGSRGLIGDVYLDSRTSDPHVTDVFVRTSTRQKSVSLDVELTGVKQAGQVHFVADMLDENGNVEKSFNTDAAVEAKDVQTVTVAWPWADPRLWDVDQPNLYTLRLKLSGGGFDDEYDQPFGFREFWVDGRQFYLNGTVIRLRQKCFYDGPFPQVGDNFSEFGSQNIDTRGDRSDDGPQLTEADRKGYLAAEFILNANRYVTGPGGIIWQTNQQRALERTAVWMRHYRNHPSVIMWIAGFNLFNNSVDCDPRNLGQHGTWNPNDTDWQKLLAAGQEMFAGMKQLDPTRVYYSHSGADTGDFYTMNSYLDLLPIQEQDDWLSEWARSGQMPIGMC